MNSTIDIDGLMDTILEMFLTFQETVCFHERACSTIFDFYKLTTAIPEKFPLQYVSNYIFI